MDFIYLVEELIDRGIISVRYAYQCSLNENKHKQDCRKNWNVFLDTSIIGMFLKLELCLAGRLNANPHNRKETNPMHHQNHGHTRTSGPDINIV
jgi:hypothetical protein